MEEVGTADKNPGTRGCQPKVFKDVFKAVVQVVLIFGLEMSVLTPAWDGPWGASNTGLKGRQRGDSQRDGRRGDW